MKSKKNQASPSQGSSKPAQGDDQQLSKFVALARQLGCNEEEDALESVFKGLNVKTLETEIEPAPKKG